MEEFSTTERNKGNIHKRGEQIVNWALLYGVENVPLSILHNGFTVHTVIFKKINTRQSPILHALVAASKK